MKANLPETGQPRVVIVGGGFGGLKLARKLAGKSFQVVLIDKNNFHQFQPLFYQVVTAGLEPSSISFPFRKMFQSIKNVHFRMGEVKKVYPNENYLETDFGRVNFDHLVLATGADTNFFGNQNIQKYTLPMKSVGEALTIRNTILRNYEKALSEESPQEIQSLLNIVVVGGGPTGVEVSGTLAEMKRIILPKDYPELNFNSMNIYLIEASPKVLSAMSEISSTTSKKYLEKLNPTVVNVSSEIEKMMKIFKVLADKKNLSIKFSGTKECEIFIDPTIFNQILNNVVGNALKYTEKGDVSIYVEKEFNNINIMVQDTGIGISEGFKPLVFQPFERGTTTDTKNSTGLGLFIVKRYVELFNGKITFQSQLNKGTIFYLSFPAHQAI